MDPKFSCILIPIILLAWLPLYYASNIDAENGFAKQRRLFNKFNGNLRIPIGDTYQEDAFSDDSESASAPDTSFLEELLRQRQRTPYAVLPPNTEYDQIFDENNYDSAKELEQGLPYGIQNVFDGTSARTPRSKSHLPKGQVKETVFQSLCLSKRETVFLNLDPDFEYRPDHYEEVKCAHEYDLPSENKIRAAVCGEVGFACIQLNRTLFLTRRPRGSSCWESATRIVPAGCECMWPKHIMGDIKAHH